MVSRPTATGARALPTGTLTFLFSDIEGSTLLVNTLGPAFGTVLGRHHALLRERRVHIIPERTEGEGQS